jgi:hypothetical protein
MAFDEAGVYEAGGGEDRKEGKVASLELLSQRHYCR